MQDFIAHVQHEFKTPLTSLALTNEIASEATETKKLAEENIEYIEQLNRILEALLIFVEADVGNKTLEKCSLENIVHTIVQQIEAKHQTPRKVLVKKTGSANMYLHRGTLETVLINVLDNARKYSENNSAIRVIITDQGIHIEDEGRGMDKEEMKHIRSPFRQ
jgi:signal transduction histidine kinase